MHPRGTHDDEIVFLSRALHLFTNAMQMRHQINAIGHIVMGIDGPRFADHPRCAVDRIHSETLPGQPFGITPIATGNIKGALTRQA